ncbi:LCP family protein ['Paenibacillus yunnanensis' Narsing Rao et al. 2020]|uniref:LCP family protein n=1 Tax=Paenibacillus tengchongensis TaxID=2608684 RepID=UPI00124D188A|nr:LCP family protein [Paenibacillus tengchongensis]
MSRGNDSLPPRRTSGPQTQRRNSANTVPPAKGKPKKTKKKRSLAARLFRLVLILVLLAFLAVAAYAGYLYWLLEKRGVGIDQPVEEGMMASTKPITMLLLGTDNRPEHPSNLTDVIMVVSMNPAAQSATVVSLPRDTYVELSGYKKTKINAFYSRFKGKEDSSGITAEDEMKTFMGKYLDVDIDYVTVLDFQGFRDIVDELGGVDVNISQDMCYTDSVDGTDINLTKGPATLDGDDALDYVRYRKSNCSPKTEGSDDFDRNKRQNEVLNSLLDRMQSLGGVLKIGRVLDAVSNNMETDIEKAQIKSLISTYWKITRDNVIFVPVTGTWRSPYVYINDKELEAAKESLQSTISGAN